MFIRFILFGLLLALFGATSCQKETLLTTGGGLRFSIDTLTFDTVFTEVGSATLRLKIFNEQEQPVKLAAVRMGKGGNSPFRINVNGVPGPEVKDIDLAGRDSIYVFATVRINPDTADAPFFIQDSLVAQLNGQQFSIPFIAYGQNAHYINSEELTSQTWGAADKKPYVIVNSALVKEGATLRIVAGTRIYMHANSRLLVEGTLEALGTKQDSIIFQGDRLDRDYFGDRGYPGEWGGLYFFSRSTGSVLRHVVLRNGGNSALGALPALIQVNADSVADAVPQLYLDRVTLQNSLGYGILSFGGTVRGDNILVTSCGAQALAVFEGGSYQFNFCTFSLQGSVVVKHTDQPTLALLNYFEFAENQFRDRPLNALLRNCIIWGSLENEIICNNRGKVAYSVQFQNCVIKSNDPQTYAAATLQDCLLNVDPSYKDAEKEDYHLLPASPLKGKGIAVTEPALFVDRDDVMRAGQWDIGCYRVP
jgi:hypothetical protein